MWFCSCKNPLKWKHYNEYADFSYTHPYVTGQEAMKGGQNTVGETDPSAENTQGHENKGTEELTVTACQRAKQRWVSSSFPGLLCLKTVSGFLHLKSEGDVRRWQQMVYHDSSRSRNTRSHLVINYCDNWSSSHLTKSWSRHHRSEHKP